MNREEGERDRGRVGEEGRREGEKELVGAAGRRQGWQR